MPDSLAVWALPEERLCPSCIHWWSAPWDLWKKQSAITAKKPCRLNKKQRYGCNPRSQDGSKKRKKAKAFDYKHIIKSKQRPVACIQRKERMKEWLKVSNCGKNNIWLEEALNIKTQDYRVPPRLHFAIANRIFLITGVRNSIPTAIHMCSLPRIALMLDV